MVPLIGHVNIMRYACIQSRRINFLIIPDTAVECQLAYQALIELLSELGFQINWDKAVEPCQRLTFLGIDIDTVRKQLTLPERKLCELRLVLSETTAKRSITKRHLESLVGKLNLAARVVFGGRILWRLLALLTTAAPTPSCPD